jgi:hypothetical protein
MRNAVRRQAATTEAEGTEEELEAGDDGGSPGIPTTADPNEPKYQITLAADMVVGDAKDAKSEAAPPARKFRVVGAPYGGYPIVFQNMVYKLQNGKEVSEASFNLANLRRQGVQLQEVT